MSKLSEAHDPRISHRSFEKQTLAYSWEEIWEAGPYFDRFSELLEDAKYYAIIVGWQIDSRLRLKKPYRPQNLTKSETSFETLREKILRICNQKPDFHFYFLIWDHAYFYVLERETWQGRVWENIHDRIHFVFDNRHPFGVSHHEKIISFDGKTVLCGGIDLCDERWDSPNHLYSDPRRSLHRQFENHGPYHDIAIQVTGPICQDIQKRIETRWKSLSTISFPKAEAKEEISLCLKGHSVYFSRTEASLDYQAKRPAITRQIEFLFRDLIFSARKRIIIEGQYYWSKVLNDLLISKMASMKGKDFEVVVILSELQNIKSLTRYMTVYEAGLIQSLQAAAEFHQVKLILGSPCVAAGDNEWGSLPKAIYIHSKVLIIDDDFISIGSANLATRALRLDTEVQLTLLARSEYEKCHIRKFSKEILEHWNVYSKNEKKSVYLKPFKPLVEVQHLKSDFQMTQALLANEIFDPQMPWSYFLKSWVYHFRKKNLDLIWIGFFWLWLLGILFSALLSSVWGAQSLSNNWITFYHLLWVSVWVFPVPFLLLVLISTLQLGIHSTVWISVSAFWVAALMGYFVTRTFPTLSQSFYKIKLNSRLSKQLGKRSFAEFLKMIFDPSSSLRSKMIYSGMYCVPLPWYLFGMIVIYPTLVYSLAHLVVMLIRVKM